MNKESNTIEATTRLLASTSHWMASVRALENSRPDRLIKDPWASALAGHEGFAWMKQRSEESVLPIVLRTRFFDDFLLQVSREFEKLGKDLQVVLLAAGLDTRSYRLPWPEGTKLFELDQPAVLSYKAEILSSNNTMPNCVRITMGQPVSACANPKHVTDHLPPNQEYDHD